MLWNLKGVVCSFPDFAELWQILDTCMSNRICHVIEWLMIAPTTFTLLCWKYCSCWLSE